MRTDIHSRNGTLLSFLCCALIANSCDRLERTPDIPLSNNSAAAAGLKPIHLPLLIEKLLPINGENHYWERGLDAPISWITNGVETSSSGQSVRVGIARVHVANRFATVLEDQKKELAWTIRLSTDGPMKFGPDVVQIEIGTPTETCFGTLYSGCDFDPEEAFANSKFETLEICRDRLGAGNEKIVYRVNTDTRSGFVTYSISSGSGGVSTWLEISKSDPCRELNSPRTSPTVSNW